VLIEIVKKACIRFAGQTAIQVLTRKLFPMPPGYSPGSYPAMPEPGINPPLPRTLPALPPRAPYDGPVGSNPLGNASRDMVSLAPQPPRISGKGVRMDAQARAQPWNAGVAGATSLPPTAFPPMWNSRPGVLLSGPLADAAGSAPGNLRSRVGNADGVRHPVEQDALIGATPATGRQAPAETIHHGRSRGRPRQGRRRRTRRRQVVAQGNARHI